MTAAPVPAIRAVGLSKTFLVPHEARAAVRDYFLHPLRRTSYEEHRALVDVSFSIEAGEFFGVIGPNGSGKSTLLKLLAGIYRPDSGSVEINGKVSPFIELGVGFNAELSARDNIRINGTLLGLTSRQLEARFDDIVHFAELERFVDQKLKNYSSGMQLRLAYAIAIQVPFDILLLDEVLAVGDQAFQEKCFATFEQMRAGGKTVVLVTHGLSSVTQFCDRALLLRDGGIDALGPPEDVVGTYLEQERARAAREMEVVTLAEPPPAEEAEEAEEEPEPAARPTAATFRELGRLPSREEIAEMAPADIAKLFRDQEVRLRHRAEKLAEAGAVRDELAEARREIVQLGLMTEIMVRRHYDEVPLPPEELRARMSTRSSVVNYLAQGITAADKAVSVFGETPSEPVLEWGCGSGRALRWLLCYPAWRERYRGCDPDPEAVAWAVANLGCDIQVCSDEPPLPYPDETFGGVFALGMLTRIHPERHRAWHAELSRVLRPGAVALLGAQGPGQVPEGKSGDRRTLSEDFAAQGWAYVRVDGRAAGFVSDHYTRCSLDGLLELVEYLPRGHGTTDLYVVRRPAR